MSNLQINTRVRRLAYYLDDFEKGRIRIPLFQRDVEWRDNQKLKLFDSIKNGYPIGTILFWRPEVKDEISNIDFELSILGAYYLDERDTEFFYILDGYQRLSTLLNCLINPNKTSLERDNEIWYKEFCIYFDLETEVFRKYNGRDINKLEVHKIPLYLFADNMNFYDFQERLIHEKVDTETSQLYLQRYKNIGNVFYDYLIPSIDLSGGNIQEAIEIFNRVNSEGSQIKDDWKLSALTINDDFRLGTLIGNTLKEIESRKFLPFKKREGFKDKFIFKTIQSSFGPLYLDTKATDVKTLSGKPDFSEVIHKTLNNCIKTVDFFQEYLVVFDIKFIPANLHYIFVVQYFNIKSFMQQDDIVLLKKWFWQSSYTNCFTKYNPAKRKKAFDHFIDFCRGRTVDPFYWDNDVNLTVDKFPNKIDFGGVRKQTLALFMINYSIYGQNMLSDEHIMIDSVSGVTEYKLFRNESSIGNTVFIVNQRNSLNQEIKQHSSLQFLLSNEYRGQFSELFITDEMRDLFAQKRNKELLELRENLIKQLESNFILDLDLTIS